MDGQRDAVWGTWPSPEEPLTHEAIHGHRVVKGRAFTIVTRKPFRDEDTV